MFKIGITPSIMYPNPARTIYNGRPLLYIEQSMASFFSHQDFLSFILSIPTENYLDYLQRVIPELDGLVLSGGGDVEPTRYHEEAMRPEWKGDPLRDAYEFEAVQIAYENDIPILGICRGHQVLNVAFGGSLFQDISEQNENTLEHRSTEKYEKNSHEVYFTENGTLLNIYTKSSAQINSVHHQGIKDLAKGFRVEARSTKDDIIESIKWSGKEFMRGVQWHPEFQDPNDHALLPTAPLLNEFRAAMQKRKAV